jgi:macrophage erythroblast attacher
MYERFNHLGTIEGIQSQADPEYNRWSDTRLDRWLVDWTLRSGMEKTAKQLASERNIEVFAFVERSKNLA